MHHLVVKSFIRLDVFSRLFQFAAYLPEWAVLALKCLPKWVEVINLFADLTLQFWHDSLVVLGLGFGYLEGGFGHLGGGFAFSHSLVDVLVFARFGVIRRLYIDRSLIVHFLGICTLLSLLIVLLLEGLRVPHLIANGVVDVFEARVCPLEMFLSHFFEHRVFLLQMRDRSLGKLHLLDPFGVGVKAGVEYLKNSLVHEGLTQRGWSSIGPFNLFLWSSSLNRQTHLIN